MRGMAHDSYARRHNTKEKIFGAPKRSPLEQLNNIVREDEHHES